MTASDTPSSDRRIALVTGGTRGIGKAVAMRLAEDGLDVIVNFKSDAETAAATVAELEACGVRAWAHAADISDAKAIRGMFRWLKTEGPNRLDVLVHNAAFGTMAPLLRTGRYSWNATYETNVTAMLELGKAAHPFLKRQGGQIVGISSIGASLVYSEYASIGTSKAALEHLLRYMAFEWIGDGIRVNGLSMGPVETRAIEWFKHPEAVRNYASTKAPTNRIGMPSDAAGVVSFLCSSDSEWLVGQVLYADGGISLGENFGHWMPSEDGDEG